MAKARASSEYVSCTAEFGLPILIGQITTDIAQNKLMKAAEKVCKNWVKKAIPFVGWVNTGFSVYKTLKLFWNARKRNPVNSIIAFQFHYVFSVFSQLSMP